MHDTPKAFQDGRWSGNPLRKTWAHSSGHATDWTGAMEAVSLFFRSSGVVFLLCLAPVIGVAKLSPLLAIAYALPFAGYVAYLGYLKLTGNFHDVVPGEVYRSALPTKTQLRRYHADKGIRSVINLRGPHQGAPWYEMQIAQAKSLGLNHYDFAMSARRPMPQERAQKLVELMRDAPKPMLIHCKAGADRTGLASALYLAAISGAEKQKAESEISMRYGHFCVPYVSYSHAVWKNWNSYAEWLGFRT